LSTRLKDKKEKLLKILESLAEESKNGIPIIVEGKKDVNTLRKLGIKGIIITIKTKGKSFLNLISEIKQLEASKVILLLDFDKRGKEGTKCFQQNLEHNKIKYNLTYWRELIALTSKKIQYIESLDAYLFNLDKKLLTTRRN
jgi:2,5-diamino-6-(ribosylamino)-4(3H)-pyrimidinone 5'-phosphate reductase